MELPKLGPPTFKLPFINAIELTSPVKGTPFSVLDSYITELSKQPSEAIEANLNKVVSSITSPKTEKEHKVNIKNIEEARAYQESMVLQTVIPTKTFDFLEDVCKINNSLSKDFLQNASIKETYDYCYEKFNHLRAEANLNGFLNDIRSVFFNHV